MKRTKRESSYEHESGDDDDEEELRVDSEADDPPRLSDHDSDNIVVNVTKRVTRNKGKGRAIDTPEVEEPRKLRDRQPKNYWEPAPKDAHLYTLAGESSKHKPRQEKNNNHGFLADMQLGYGALGPPDIGMMPDSDSVSVSSVSWRFLCLLITIVGSG